MEFTKPKQICISPDDNVSELLENTKTPAEKILQEILPILKKGNDVQIKHVGNELHIIEIQRKIKYRMTFITG